MIFSGIWLCIFAFTLGCFGQSYQYPWSDQIGSDWVHVVTTPDTGTSPGRISSKFPQTSKEGFRWLGLYRPFRRVQRQRFHCTCTIFTCDERYSLRNQAAIEAGEKKVAAYKVITDEWEQLDLPVDRRIKMIRVLKAHLFC